MELGSDFGQEALRLGNLSDSLIVRVGQANDLSDASLAEILNAHINQVNVLKRMLIIDIPAIAEPVVPVAEPPVADAPAEVKE